MNVCFAASAVCVAASSNRPDGQVMSGESEALGFLRAALISRGKWPLQLHSLAGDLSLEMGKQSTVSVGTASTRELTWEFRQDCFSLAQACASAALHFLLGSFSVCVIN